MKYAESRSARQHLIQNILANKAIASQNELLVELKKKGFAITQTTLSRDLDELGAIKTNDKKVKLNIPFLKLTLTVLVTRVLLEIVWKNWQVI